MPLMRMSRDFILAGTTIPTIVFAADKEVWVVDRAVREALKYGAVFADEGEREKLETSLTEKPNQAPEGPERDAKITSAMEDMIMSDVRDQFSASGTPKLEVLGTMVGFTVNKKEAEHLWQTVLRSKSGSVTETNVSG